MTDPKTARGRKRKSTIVNAAAALMHKRGGRATALEDVLVESGSGKSQFYHYFSSKDDLVAAVLEYQGGYLLSTAHHDIGPMQTALATAYTQLRASRPIR